MKSAFLIGIICGLATVLSAQSLFDSIYTVNRYEIYFASGRWDLSDEDGLLLDSIARLALQMPRFEGILVTAHTDSIGNQVNNDYLARRRASTVAAELLERGIDAATVRTTALGERNPKYENATETGRQRNRRAIIQLLVSVPMVEVTGQVKDKETSQGVEAVVYISSRSRADSIQTDTEGYYTVRLPKDTIVKIEAAARNYLFESHLMRVFGSPALLKRYKQNPDLELPPARPGARISIQNLFFVGDQAVLLKISEKELPKVLRFMKLNPHLRIEIAGHVNNPPGLYAAIDSNTKRHEQLWNLSEARARSVYTYLVENGIPADRMVYKGYGDSEMLFTQPPVSEEEQQQNRRVEIRVLKEDK